MGINPDRQTALNKSLPAADQAKLGDILADLISAYNTLATKHNAVCAKLDLDAGVTDTNYVALQGGAALVTTIDNR